MSTSMSRLALMFSTAFFGVLDTSSGEILYARNPDGYFAPASNAKLFTTVLALATLGPDYRRVRIGVAHPGEKSRVSGHVLGSFSKAELEWFIPMVEAIVDAAPHLAKDDDAGFMNKVALMLNPPEKKPKPAKDE